MQVSKDGSTTRSGGRKTWALDVLVHGEFERNDMVRYFGEQLRGYAFTQHGWVQSYGSRCVTPPIIWGDVSRPSPMTVRWSAYAQSRTARPVKRDADRTGDHAAMVAVGCGR